MHLVIKMFLFELALGEKAKKLMDLTIPMWLRDHSKEVVEMVKGQEEKYIWTKKLLQSFKMRWKTCQQNMKACKA
jgi:hypothetical protein